jgi:hypothetical protein
MSVKLCFSSTREGHVLMMFENRVLRRIFGPMKERVGGGWRRLHNEELNNLYTSPYIIRVMKSRMRCAAHMGEMRNKYNILVRRLGGKKPCRTPRQRHRVA